MIKHTQRTPPFALQFVLLRCDLSAYWNPTDSGMNSFMNCCTGTRLQTCPERDASTEWRNPLLPAQVSWKCFKIGMRDQTVAQKGRFLPVIALYGWEGEHVSVEGSVRRAAPRRAGTPVTANRANITHLTAKRDNFDWCPTCAGEERRATGQQRMASFKPRPASPASPETSSQLQSASVCVFCFFFSIHQ